MALITRTVGNAFGELKHFVVLFMFVLAGYAVAGSLHFGEQHEGFSTVQKSILTLFVSLIALDPSSFITHVDLASSWSFQIFFWSWLCLAFFILVCRQNYLLHALELLLFTYYRCESPN
jgi:hypothetical protein